MEWPFSKYVGCGNDFIIFDNREGAFPSKDEQLIKHLCHRQCGIEGADGVILLENSDRSDFRMRIFNSDGSEAEMCGNGIRCIMKFLEQAGLKGPKYEIETMKRVHRIEHVSGGISVEMGSPAHCQWDISLDFQGRQNKATISIPGCPLCDICTGY